MKNPIAYLRSSLVAKLSIAMGVILLATVSIETFFNINYQAGKFMQANSASADRVGKTILLGTHYAMMLNSREDIHQIISNVGQQEDIVSLRIYSKSGDIKFSKDHEELGQRVDMKAPTCAICHVFDPPRANLSQKQRTRIFTTANGHRAVGITSPIYNEPGCSTGDCHFHQENIRVLGIMDVAISMMEADREVARFNTVITVVTSSVFLATCGIIFFTIFRFVKQPIGHLVKGTQWISQGDYTRKIEITQNNEIGVLAEAINRMGDQIAIKEDELNRQRDEYQKLFEVVPCIITVQDKNYRLLTYNKRFSERFDPKPGDFCYSAYKGRTEKCENCPVEKTFTDGQSHFSEESGIGRDGRPRHWLVRTSPILDENGDIVAAMEINLDITPRKELEAKLVHTEQQYHAIFNNIPNPVFVLDTPSLNIRDCNGSVLDLYGYHPEELIGRSFMDLFSSEEIEQWRGQITADTVLNQARHKHRDGHTIFVDIRISPSGHPGDEALLAAVSDITKRLEAEQQLVQAGKMATLGEMATGVAHELNQPLSVIKTASSFFMRKVSRKEPIGDDILFTMSQEIDSHVDRATKIINHMREFGRKSAMSPEWVQVNDVIERAFDIFSQQLKLREIEVIRELDASLPRIKSDPSRLEQVFINLLINARDAIEERSDAEPLGPPDKRITIRSYREKDQAVIQVEDTGIGVSPTLNEKVFEPFFTTKKVGKGTGLGLSISYGIIQDSGGSIRFLPRSTPGACIEIRFQLVEEES
ncbi:MAG: PAS domain S-box protein [Pseudomonadota bacterium]